MEKIDMTKKYAIIGNAEARSFKFTVLATTDSLPPLRSLAQYARKWYAVIVMEIKRDEFGDICYLPIATYKA